MNGSTEGVLFGLALTLRPDGGVTAETFGDGMTRATASAYLRRIADALEAEAVADGEPVGDPL